MVGQAGQLISSRVTCRPVSSLYMRLIHGALASLSAGLNHQIGRQILSGYHSGSMVFGSWE